MNTKKMRIVLDDGAYMPVRGHKTDAGLDIKNAERCYRSCKRIGKL